MTISEFKRDVSSRSCRYTSLVEHDKSLPVEVMMHVSEVIADDEYPAVISFNDGNNFMQLTQVQSINLEEDHYTIVCGITNDVRRVVTVFFEAPLM